MKNSIINVMCCMCSFIAHIFHAIWENSPYIWRFTRTHYYEFDPKSQRRTIRRRNAENSRSGLSSQRLVSSRRYLSPERTARRGTRTLHHLPMISFSRFSSLHRVSSSILTSLSRYKRRGNEEEGRITNCENQEIASSAASQRQAWPMLKKLLSASSLIRFRGRLYPED